MRPPRFAALGLVLLVGASGLLVATPSLASWTDVEYVRADAAAADCTAPGSCSAPISTRSRRSTASRWPISTPP